MKRSKRHVVWSSVVFGALVVGGIFLYLGMERANPAASTVMAAAKSGDYGSVSKAVAAGKLNASDVRLAVREEFQNQTIQRVNAFFDTTDPKEKQAIVDKAIDDLQKFRAEAKKRPPTTGPATRPVATVNPQLAMVGWALSQPAATRARLAEFRVVFEKRLMERGLPGLFDNGASLPLGQPTK